jgi:hypothetical protein
MRDTLGAARQWLAREIDSKSALPSKPIAADPWIVSSLLQKSIRRSELSLLCPRWALGHVATFREAQAGWRPF